MSTRPLLTGVTALTLLLAACGGSSGTGAGGTTSAGPASTAPSSAAPTATGTAGGTAGHTDSPGDGSGHAPPFQADTQPDTGQASTGAHGTITDIRIGHHDGFDRVVFEFHGTGTPGWNARYVDRASSQGSGQAIDVPGRAVLSVAITGVGYPTETGIPEVPRGPVAVAGTDVVTQVFFDGTFEGVSQAFVGTTGKLPFRVYLLTAPARIVLEVAEH